MQLTVLRRILVAIGLLLTVVGLIDVPAQLQKWAQALRALADSAPAIIALLWTSQGRFALVAVGVALTLAALDVPQRLWAKLKSRRRSPQPTPVKPSLVAPGGPPTTMEATYDVPNELWIRLKREQAALLVVLTNRNPTAPPKSGFSVAVEAMQRWSDEERVFYAVPEFEKSPKPRRLRLVRGDRELYFERSQIYRLFEKSDAKRVLFLIYTSPATSSTTGIPLSHGIWFIKIRVSWHGQSTDFDTFVEWSHSDEVPAVVGDPRTAAMK